MTWTQLSTQIPNNTNLISGISSGLSVIKTSLEGLKGILALRNISLNINNSLNTIITSVNNLITGLTIDSGIYILKIPPPKKGLININSQNETNGELGSNFVTFPRNNILNGLSQEIQNALRSNPVFEQAFNPSTNFVGGNAHILKTITDSIFDRGDNNRPLFNNDSKWAYMLLMCGAGDITSIIPKLNSLEHLVGSRNNVSPGISKNMSDIIATNINTRISNRGTGIIIEWDSLLSRVLNNYDGSTIIPTEIAIIRSEQFQAKTARTVSDLFGSNNLTVGQLGRFGAKVLNIITFDGITNKFLDNQVGDKNYIYHIAVKTRMEPPKDIQSAILNPLDENSTIPTNTDMGYNLLSNASEIRFQNRTQPNLTGTAPDWERTPKIFNAISNLVDNITERLNSLGDNSNDINTLNQQILQNVDDDIKKISDKITELDVIANQVASAFGNLPSTGVFINYNIGEGPVNTFINILASELNNINDSNRPDFNDDFYTAGIIMLAVGPDLTKVQAFLDFVNTLLNPTITDNPVTEIVEGASTLHSEALTNLQATIENIQLGFNANMSGRDSGNSRCD